MTGYEIRNAIRRSYGVDAADHLFEDRFEQPARIPILRRVLVALTMAVKGVL